MDVQWLQMARPDMVSVILVTLLQLCRSREIATATNIPDQSPRPTLTNNAIVVLPAPHSTHALQVIQHQFGCYNKYTYPIVPHKHLLPRTPRLQEEENVKKLLTKRSGNDHHPVIGCGRRVPAISATLAWFRTWRPRRSRLLSAIC